MTTYVLTITNIENGELNYNAISGVFFKFEDAKAKANEKMKEQARIWGVKPTLRNKVEGYMAQVEVKHPTMDIVKVYTLQACEAE